MRWVGAFLIVLVGCAQPAPVPDFDDLEWSEWPLPFEQRRSQEVAWSDELSWANLTFDGPHMVVNQDGQIQEAYALRSERFHPAGDEHGYEVASHRVTTQWIGADLRVIREDSYCQGGHCSERHTVTFPLFRTRDVTTHYGDGGTWSGPITTGPTLPAQGFAHLRILAERGSLAGVGGDPGLNPHELVYDGAWRLTLERHVHGDRPRDPTVYTYADSLDVSELTGDVVWGPATRPPEPGPAAPQATPAAGDLFAGSGLDPWGVGFTLDDAWATLQRDPRATGYACIAEAGWYRDPLQAFFRIGPNETGRFHGWVVEDVGAADQPVLLASRGGSGNVGPPGECDDAVAPTGAAPWSGVTAIVEQMGHVPDEIRASFFGYGYQARVEDDAGEFHPAVVVQSSPTGKLDSVRATGARTGDDLLQSAPGG